MGRVLKGSFFKASYAPKHGRECFCVLYRSLFVSDNLMKDNICVTSNAKSLLTCTFQKFLAYLPGRRKKPPLCKGRWHAKRDGRIVKNNNYVGTIPQPPTASAPFTQGSLFMFTYDLSILRTSTAFCIHKRKIRLRYTVFLQNCPLERRSYAVPLIRPFSFCSENHLIS